MGAEAADDVTDALQMVIELVGSSLLSRLQISAPGPRCSMQQSRADSLLQCRVVVSLSLSMHWSGRCMRSKERSSMPAHLGDQC